MSRISWIAGALLLASGAASAQSWSEAQLAVWTVVQQSWEDDTGRTGKWPTAYAVDGYTSWGADSAAPIDLAESDRYTRFRDTGTEKTVYYRLAPLAITIDGDTAVAHYYMSGSSEDGEGQRETSVMGITEVLVLRDGVWKYLTSADWQPDFE